MAQKKKKKKKKWKNYHPLLFNKFQTPENMVFHAKKKNRL